MDKYENIPYSRAADLFLNHNCPGRQSKESVLKKEKQELTLINAQNKLLAHLKTYINYRNLIKNDIERLKSLYNEGICFKDDVLQFLNDNTPAKKLVNYYINN